MIRLQTVTFRTKSFLSFDKYFVQMFVSIQISHHRLKLKISRRITFDIDICNLFILHKNQSPNVIWGKVIQLEMYLD